MTTTTEGPTDLTKLPREELLARAREHLSEGTEVLNHICQGDGHLRDEPKWYRMEGLLSEVNRELRALAGEDPGPTVEEFWEERDVDHEVPGPEVLFVEEAPGVEDALAEAEILEKILRRAVAGSEAGEEREALAAAHDAAETALAALRGVRPSE